MVEETSIITKPLPELKFKEAPESKAFNVSLRGWVCLLVVATICYMSIAQIEIKEPLYTLGGMVIGYYFAQSKKTGNDK
jgi:hypothetical protein